MSSLPQVQQLGFVQWNRRVVVSRREHRSEVPGLFWMTGNQTDERLQPDHRIVMLLMQALFVWHHQSIRFSCLSAGDTGINLAEQKRRILWKGFMSLANHVERLLPVA